MILSRPLGLADQMRRTMPGPFRSASTLVRPDIRTKWPASPFPPVGSWLDTWYVRTPDLISGRSSKLYSCWNGLAAEAATHEAPSTDTRASRWSINSPFDLG